MWPKMAAQQVVIIEIPYKKTSNNKGQFVDDNIFMWLANSQCCGFILRPMMFLNKKIGDILV